MTDPRPSDRRPQTESELVEHIRSIDVRAPETLHRQIDSMISARSRSPRADDGTVDRRRPLRPRLAAGGAIAAALIALAIVVGFSGSSSTLSVRDASALTLRAATTGAPADSPSDRRQLAAGVDGVSFPYWGERFGWHATGARTDHVGGHTVTTIFYSNRHGQRIGYAIASGGSAPQISGGVVAMRDGTPYRLLTVNGVAVVTWLRDGHLCVVSGRGVDGATLLRLASWDDHRSVAS